jgi:hypothetical protein
MANLRLEIENNEYVDSDNERSDSMITQFDEEELDEMKQSHVTINHCTPPATSVMLMNSYFDFVYAKALINVKSMIVKKHCYGCFKDHPSQTQHDCIMSDLMYDDEQAYDFYFEEMLLEVDETKVLQAWEVLVQGLNLSHEVIYLHKQVLANKDFREVMKTKLWKSKMKKTIQTILHAEHRLFSE